MDRILTIAASEFVTATRSKGFLLGLLLMPLIVVGSVVVQRAMAQQADRSERRVGVVDERGDLFAAIERAAEEWNAGVRPDGRRVTDGPTFSPVRVDAQARAPEALRFELSERVRRQELFAFVELPAGLVEGAPDARLRYYSATASYTVLPDWLKQVVTREVLRRRIEAAEVSPQVVAALLRPVPSQELGLPGRDADGQVRDARPVDRVRTFLVPVAYVAILFIIVLTTTPQLLNSVLEEKMSRISEVLLGSVSPFQLMMGKLLASAGVSLVLAAMYVGGAVGLAHYHGYGDAVSGRMLAWLLVYLCLSVLIYGAIFMAIGAACTDLKDAQSMMTPAMMLIMVPAFTWTGVIRAPDSTFSVAVTLFPTATPFLMVLRMALQEPPPAWQVALGFALTVGTMLALVWAAGRIFRTGLLMQGKSATVGEMWRWLRA
jgi:ABC-2 type transport system permease protein